MVRGNGSRRLPAPEEKANRLKGVLEARFKKETGHIPRAGGAVRGDSVG